MTNRSPKAIGSSWKYFQQFQDFSKKNSFFQIWSQRTKNKVSTDYVSHPLRQESHRHASGKALWHLCQRLGWWRRWIDGVTALQWNIDVITRYQVTNLVPGNHCVFLAPVVKKDGENAINFGDNDFILQDENRCYESDLQPSGCLSNAKSSISRYISCWTRGVFHCYRLVSWGKSSCRDASDWSGSVVLMLCGQQNEDANLLGN